MDPQDHHVVVLGASFKHWRYSNQAIVLLKQHEYRVTPVHPRADVIEALTVVNRLEDISEPVDTLTLYVGPERLDKLMDAIVALAPGRVIFNPGSESVALQGRLDANGIAWLEGCTLVMLRTGTFDPEV